MVYADGANPNDDDAFFAFGCAYLPTSAAQAVNPNTLGAIMEYKMAESDRSDKERHLRTVENVDLARKQISETYFGLPGYSEDADGLVLQVLREMGFAALSDVGIVALAKAHVEEDWS